MEPPAPVEREAARGGAVAGMQAQRETREPGALPARRVAAAVTAPVARAPARAALLRAEGALVVGPLAPAAPPDVAAQAATLRARAEMPQVLAVAAVRAGTLRASVADPLDAAAPEAQPEEAEAWGESPSASVEAAARVDMEERERRAPRAAPERAVPAARRVARAATVRLMQVLRARSTAVSVRRAIAAAAAAPAGFPIARATKSARTTTSARARARCVVARLLNRRRASASTLASVPAADARARLAKNGSVRCRRTPQRRRRPALLDGRPGRPPRRTITSWPSSAASRRRCSTSRPVRS